MAYIRLWICLLVLEMSAGPGLGQAVEVKGTVFDRSQLFAMPGVSVLGTGGQGTMTDSSGRYSIRVARTDSIYFSYLGKFTQRFAVRRLSPGFPLDMSLAVSVDSLPLVVVRPKAYRYDSLENRQEYRKVFDYQPEYLVGGADGGMGFNLDMLFNAKKNRQMLALQRRLLEEERDKYVDHRFNKTLVKKITGLQGEALDTFMKAYRPSYEFIINCENDYEYYKYIKDWSKDFWEEWKVRHLRDQLNPGS
ncbi:MAG TPA: hypothetical protein VNU72_08100 [Puia sp.]|nr:hypothetical protein [Puia sp.]